jgi:predicted dehydrogenase
MVDPVRIGLIGAGFIADAGHMPGIAAHPEAEAIVACDFDQARLAQFAEKWQIPRTVETWQELLETPGLDAVSVCLPNALHAEVTQAALNKGLAVMCEKPMALTTADADDMVLTSVRTGKMLAIKVHNRYRRSCLKAQEIIASGVLGDIYHAEVRSYRRSGIPGIGSWFTQRKLAGGGALADCGIHPLDAACWLLGSPKVATVSGITSDRIGKLAAAGKPSVAGAGLSVHQHNAVTTGDAIFDVEDQAFGFVRFIGGSSLVISATWSGSVDETETIHLFGTLGGIKIDWSNDGDAITVYGLTPEDDQTIVFNPDEDGGIGPWPAAHIRSTQAFIDAVLGGAPTPVDPAGVAKVMHIIQAIYDSAAAGREIAL